MKQSSKKSLEKRGILIAGRAQNAGSAQVHADKRRPPRNLEKQRLKTQVQHETARNRGPFPFYVLHFLWNSTKNETNFLTSVATSNYSESIRRNAERSPPARTDATCEGRFRSALRRIDSLTKLPTWVFYCCCVISSISSAMLRFESGIEIHAAAPIGSNSSGRGASAGET